MDSVGFKSPTLETNLRQKVQYKKNFKKKLKKS